ncbi:predicted protein [Sclerotinia sclerotiorum 1980 UF-70]|uniref:Uncharacterized protein n=1 Tax=Sclerotinia sclerotiorum (strain ATCC 18683 / 1980 / Ss-1) TaxID=665079 RepID=A7EEV9_SCLS1|nr:predicted protein [Sclerotinia sclerotiorum 1980 UF-70]EDO01375.1 predicted protein [Sclerotinia sclerotiorum 1980 UF-70]
MWIRLARFGVDWVLILGTESLNKKVIRPHGQCKKPKKYRQISISASRSNLKYAEIGFHDN